MKISELFDSPSSNNWTQEIKSDVEIYKNQFDFNGHTIKVYVERSGLTDAHTADFLKRKEINFPHGLISYSIVFSVDTEMRTLGIFGTSSTKLFGQIISSLKELLSSIPWDVLTFSGDEGSRNKLYLALTQMISNQYNARYTKFDDEFYIYRNEIK